MSNPKYRIEVIGRQPGVDEDLTVGKLRKVPETAAKRIASGEALVIKSGVDLQTAAKYEQALQECGCTSRVLPDQEAPLSIDPTTFGPAPSVLPHTTAAPAARVSGEAPGRMAVFWRTSPWYHKAVLIIFAVGVFIAVVPKTQESGVIASPVAKQPEAATVSPSGGLLEAAVDLESSTPSKFGVYKDKGGLDADRSWKGFRTNTVHVVHDPATGKVMLLEIGVDKSFPGFKLASFENVKASLQRECGTQWQANEAQQRAGMLEAKTENYTCWIREQQPFVVVNIQRTMPQAALVPAAQTQPSTNAPAGIAFLNPAPVTLPRVVVQTGEHPWKFVSENKAAFQPMLGASFGAFLSGLEVASEVTLEKGSVFGEGMAPHSGGDQASAFWVHQNGRVFAVVRDIDAPVKVAIFGAKQLSELPPRLAEFARKE